MDTVQKTYFADIKQSDRNAFEEFFRLYYALLCNFAFQFLKEKEASEEVVQEVFFKIWDRRESIEITGSEKSYLFSAIRNACLNQIKHVNIREKYKEHNQEAIESSERKEDDFVVQQELAEKINQSIAALPEQRQIIFRLSREEGLKYKEIAAKMNLSVKTIEAQMGKALKFLRTELAEYLVLILFFTFLFK